MQKELMSDDPKGPLKEHELDSVSPESLALLFSQWAVWATVWSAHLYQLERRWGVPTEPRLVQQSALLSASRLVSHLVQAWARELELPRADRWALLWVDQTAQPKAYYLVRPLAMKKADWKARRWVRL